MDFAPETLRTRWAELTAQREAIDEKLDPKRAELDKLAAGDTDLSVRDARAREAVVRGEIKNLQAALHPIEMERAAVARALGGRTG